MARSALCYVVCMWYACGIYDKADRQRDRETRDLDGTMPKGESVSFIHLLTDSPYICKDLTTTSAIDIVFELSTT